MTTEMDIYGVCGDSRRERMALMMNDALCLSDMLGVAGEAVSEHDVAPDVVSSVGWLQRRILMAVSDGISDLKYEDAK